MSTPNERFQTIVGVVAIAGVVATFIGLYRSDTPPTILVVPPTLPAEQVTAPPVDHRRDRKESAPRQVSSAPRQAAPAKQAATPAELALRDGEQAVLLSGQASVGIQFNQVGEESFMTLTINSETGSARHAVLSSGERVAFRVGEKQYYVSILNLDFAGKTARLRIDAAQ